MNNNFLIKLICILFFLAILCAACTIPFYFESPSMYYKTGMDKLMLRSGKILGVITAVLLLFQPVFVSRFSLLDKLFSIKKLFQFHRISGLILLVTALLHPVFILGADHFVFFPFESRYWPEFIGVCLLLILLVFVGISLFQKQISINYKTWHTIHKIFAPIVLGLMFIHVFKVSKSFESELPYYSLSIALVIIAFLFVRKYLR